MELLVAFCTWSESIYSKFTEALCFPFKRSRAVLRGPWGKIAKCSEKAYMFLFFFPLLQLFSLCRPASETDWMKCSCGRNFSETLVLCMVMCTSIRDCVHFNQETASKFVYQVSVIQVHHGVVNFQHNGVAEH